MTYNELTHRLISILLLVIMSITTAFAQTDDSDAPVPQARMRREGIVATAPADSIDATVNKALTDADSVASSVVLTPTTTVDTVAKIALPKEKFIPDPKKAMWMAIVLPGGGQIYNRKYWKLPLIYGGFLGCAYALTWNNTMYRDYSQAYIDIMDSDPNTKSYETFIPSSYDIEANLPRLKDLFKRKKNFYRRYRDMSVFCMIGVYALSIVDAYVDAELSSFDISDDLSMRVRPVIINDRQTAISNTGFNTQSYGLQCSLSF